MSLYSINDPKHWLDRATEARALAEQMDDPEAKRTMQMLMITSGSPKERENEQQDAGQSQSSRIWDWNPKQSFAAIGITSAHRCAQGRKSDGLSRSNVPSRVWRGRPSMGQRCPWGAEDLRGPSRVLKGPLLEWGRAAPFQRTERKLLR